MRIKEFLFFQITRFVGTIAIQMNNIIMGWQLYLLTKDPLVLGMIGLAEAIPAISLSLYGGYLADKKNRKTISILSYSCIIAMYSGIWILSWYMYDLPKNTVTYTMYTFIFISGIARGFLNPSIIALRTQIVPRHLYANAAAWSSTVWQIASIVGPIVGGIALANIGIKDSYLIVIILMIIAVSCLSLIKTKPFEPSSSSLSIRDNLKEGLRFVLKNQIFISAISLDMFAVLFGGAVAMLPAFADSVLMVGEKGLGILRAAPAIGASVMAILMAFYPPNHNSGKKLLYSVAGFGVSIVVFALSKNFYLSVVMLFLSGAFDSVSVVIRSTILQILTPTNLMGRVSAVNTMFIGSSNEIGAFESGVAARLLGLVQSVVFGGSMTILIVIATAFYAPNLRKLQIKDLQTSSDE